MFNSRSMPDRRTSEEQAVFLRLAGVLAIIGGVGYIVAGAIHQALPSGPANAVSHVADRSDWYAIHLLAMLSVATWPVVLAALATSLVGAWSRVIGRLAVGAMMVGLVLFIIEMALDGHVLKNVADAWAAATGSEQAEQFLIARSVYAVLQGNFAATLLWTTGIPFVLMGVAILLGRSYPAWLGWMALILGLMVTVFGMDYYLRTGLIPQLAGHVIPSFLLALWLIIVGVIMIRQAVKSDKSLLTQG